MTMRKLECCNWCKYQRRDKACGAIVSEYDVCPMDAACQIDTKKSFVVRGNRFKRHNGNMVTVIGIMDCGEMIDPTLGTGVLGKRIVAYIETAEGVMRYTGLDYFVGVSISLFDDSVLENFAYIGGRV